MNRLPDPYPVEPLARPLDATVPIPGSKSITNRALVCAALADGTSELTNVLAADDTDAMVGVLRAVGVAVGAGASPGSLRVDGSGGRLAASAAPVDVRQSGTTSRFSLPLLALGADRYEVDGEGPMRQRPIGETLQALRALGARVARSATGDRLPAVVQGPLRGGRVQVSGDVSSQFLSGLLLAGPCTTDGLTVEVSTALVSRPYVDMTVAVMRAFGAVVEEPDDRTFTVPPTGYRPAGYAVEPDASSASYFFAAAAIGGGRVEVAGLGSGSLQGDLAFVRVLGAMGVEVRCDGRGTEVVGTGTLHGVETDLADCSDIAQTLAVTAVFADAPTRVTGIGFIRRKETDRLAAVATELRRCGVGVIEEADGWSITPAGAGGVRPTVVRTYDDHRMAMSFALLGLRTGGIAIADPGCVAKTFPGYWDTLESLRR